ncbi:hypothetical protein U1Q18_026652 [Sarracenia purpurea var. burkii]
MALEEADELLFRGWSWLPPVWGSFPWLRKCDDGILLVCHAECIFQLWENLGHFFWCLEAPKKELRLHETDLGGDEGKVACIGAGSGAALPPIEEAEGVLGLPRHAEGVDEAGRKHRFLEPVGSALAVDGREDQPDGAEVVPGIAVGVEELPELGALLRRRFAPLNPVEEAAHHAELRFAAHFRIEERVPK